MGPSHGPEPPRQSTTSNARRRRALRRWIAAATSSFSVPSSPRIRTGPSSAAARSIRSNSACIAALRPTIPWKEIDSDPAMITRLPAPERFDRPRQAVSTRRSQLVNVQFCGHLRLHGRLMARVCRARTHISGCSRTRSSKAPGRLTCPSSSRRRWTSSSTSRPRRRSGSGSRHRCCCEPIRSSNEPAGGSQGPRPRQRS